MHKSVLLQEIMELLAPKKGDVFIDGTLGAGGHSKEILTLIGEKGKLLGIDQDTEALKISRGVLKGKNVIFAQGNFSDIEEIAYKNGLKNVDGIILDLGVSSMQIDEAKRGFSFKKEGPLDMRMDQAAVVTAETIVNEYPEKELIRIFKEYGEEWDAKRIAKKIVEVRRHERITRTEQLAEVVRGVTRAPRRVRGKNSKTKIDPATKIFQALRIETNKELKALESALPQLIRLLKKGGKFGIISFHSLEDRLVKRFIEENSKNCTCPKNSPLCVCEGPRLRKITKKPVMPSEKEIKENPRARSAKLRVAERIK